MKRCAFTLAELLMAVLVISIIMVALAPVITRRAYDNVSIEVNKKKGLEIYTNPGIYTFDVPVGINTLFLQGSAGGGGGGGATYIDKTVSFTTNTTWTIPKGVNQLTFTITGSGGGGGAGNGASASDNCVSQYKTLPAMADNGKDMCAGEPLYYNAGGYNVLLDDFALSSVSQATCWKKDAFWEDGTHLAVCTYNGAIIACRSGNGIGKSTRLFTPSEAARIIKTSNYPAQGSYLGKNYLNFCRQYRADSTLTTNMRHCGVVGKCFSSDSVECNPYLVHINEAWFMFTDASGDAIYSSHSIIGGLYAGYRIPQANTAGQVRCVYERNNWYQYSGSGGASGAKYQKTINVLPNDTLTITIGQGGNGGSPSTNVNNGISSRAGNGYQGAVTQIIHKRGAIVMGTYYVKGGFGGWGAATSANGDAVTNGTASNHTTPSGTCFSQFRTNTSGALSGGVTACSSISYSGGAGIELAGGDGGLFENKGTAARGGTLDSGSGSFGTGYSASGYGFGGGAGACARGVRNPALCSKGGKGSQGKIDITYRIVLPGSGAGAATRVGGSKLVADKSVDYEIKYLVEEGSRIMLEVGSGGAGGAAGQNGMAGSATIVGDNDIVFLAGGAGNSLNQTQKSNLSNCIGTKIFASEIASCLNNSSYKPQGGKASIINQNGISASSSNGLYIKNSSKVKYTINNANFKGHDGKTSAQLNISTIPWSYGFDGGVGGSPFGIRTNNIPASITCAGGIAAVYGSPGDANAYVCTSGDPKGNSARVHDPINNDFGGSGGAGGGTVENSSELGQGSSGSSGYLRIRWDETEQE